jgi:hypothetical protein
MRPGSGAGAICVATDRVLVSGNERHIVRDPGALAALAAARTRTSAPSLHAGLASALSDAMPAVRLHAAASLGEMTGVSGGVVRSLIGALQDPHPAVFRTDPAPSPASSTPPVGPCARPRP